MRQPGGVVLDPFIGTGTTAVAAACNGFDCIGAEISENQAKWALERVRSALDGKAEEVDYDMVLHGFYRALLDLRQATLGCNAYGCVFLACGTCILVQQNMSTILETPPQQEQKVI